MPEVAVKTRDDLALAAARQLFTQEVYQPELLRAYIDALKQAVAHYKRTGQKIPNDLITKKGSVKLDDIIAALTQFNQTLSSDLSIKELDLNDLTHLDRLDSAIITVSGAAASPEAAQPPSPNVPKDLKGLVAEFEKAHQSAVQSRSQSEGWSKERFQEELAKQNAITVQMHQVRQYTLSQLEWAINNSTALENLAASLGVHPQDVKNLALKRAGALVDKNITALTFRQARTLITDPVQLAAYYTARLKKEVMADNMLILAAVDKDPKTKQKYLDTALKKTKKAAAAETEKVKPAIEAAAKNLQEHPTVAAAARRAAQETVKQVETVSLGRTDPKQQLDPKKSARLVNELKKQPNPVIRRRIIAAALKIPLAQAASVEAGLNPAVANFAASTQRFNPLLAADTTGILADALRRPHLFPKPFVDALKSGKITDAEVAEIYQIARLLDIPPNAVVLSRFGVNAQNLAANLQAGKKWLGIIPMGHGVDLQDASIAKLSDLAAAQKQLADALKSPPPFLPDRAATQFLKTSRAASRRNGLNEFFDQINIFRLPSAFSYNLGQFPQLGNIGSSGSAFVSGLRVQSGFFNTVSNVMGYFNNTVRQAPAFLTAPFRAVGNAIGNTIINPVKTWANTQIKDGLARAGAWLAKKGLTKAAKDIGMGLVGKGTAALLAQAVPVAGQIAAIALVAPDILKFLWEHKDKVGMFLGGMFLWGQMMLGNLIHLVSSLGTLGLTTGIGALLGTIFIPIPFVGTAIGAGLGFGAGLMINAAGGLGAALSGLGSALGSAAAGLSSFIGAITAPSLMVGVGGTLAAVGLSGVVLSAAIVIFFIQPAINSALFVADDKGTSAPGTGPGGGPGGAPGTGPGGQYPTCWPSYGEISQGPYCGNNPIFSHCWLKENAIDIAGGIGIPVYATHDGTATAYREAGISCYGNYVVIVSPFGFKTYYAHLADITFSGSIEINAGTQIGTQGKTTAFGCPFTGTHVHYELRPSSPNIDEVVPSYTPGGITTGCFAKDSGGGTTPLPASNLRRPTLPPTPTPIPGTCAIFGGDCLDACYGLGCGIAGPKDGFPDCKSQSKKYCCNVTLPNCLPP